MWMVNFIVLFELCLSLQMADAAKEKEPIKSVQTFGRKKTATAVAYCKRGKGVLNVNGKPLDQVNPSEKFT